MIRKLQQPQFNFRRGSTFCCIYLPASGTKTPMAMMAKISPVRDRHEAWIAWPGALRRRPRKSFPQWAIPLIYAAAAAVLGITIPRLETRYLPHLIAPMPSSVAIAIDSAVASGMLALTGIVFALAFVMVQFGAVAYSPRLVPWISRDRLMMHAMGAFTATFLYALAALA